MRKRTVRSGMRLVLVALVLIIITSFYHVSISEVLALSFEAETRFYRWGIFCAAAMGGYGVVMSALGLVLPANQKDFNVRITPAFFMIISAIALFFYLLAVSFDTPVNPNRERLRPGETITI